MLSLQSDLQLTHEAGTVHLITNSPGIHDLRFSSRKILRQLRRTVRTEGLPVSMRPAIHHILKSGQKIRIYIGTRRIWTLGDTWIDRFILRFLL